MRIQDSLKVDVNTLLARFDEQPLAAARLLKYIQPLSYTMGEVVVKVTRPAIRSQIYKTLKFRMVGDFLENALEAACTTLI